MLPGRRLRTHATVRELVEWPEPCTRCHCRRADPATVPPGDLAERRRKSGPVGEERAERLRVAVCEGDKRAGMTWEGRAKDGDGEEVPREGT